MVFRRTAILLTVGACFLTSSKMIGMGGKEAKIEAISDEVGLNGWYVSIPDVRYVVRSKSGVSTNNMLISYRIRQVPKEFGNSCWKWKNPCELVFRFWDSCGKKLPDEPGVQVTLPDTFIKERIMIATATLTVAIPVRASTFAIEYGSSNLVTKRRAIPHPGK